MGEESEQIEIKAERKGVLHKRSTEVKDGPDMHNSEAALIGDIIQEVHYLLIEDKIAEAAVLLYDINKENIDFWFRLKMHLLKHCEDHRELFLMATLINVAEKRYLSESFNLVPGLFALSRQKNESA